MDETVPAARRSMLQSWEPGVVASIAFLVGFDFLYDVVHNNAVALFAVWGAVRRNSPRARAFGAAVAWVLWLDTGLNVFENLAALDVVRSREPEPLLPVVSAIFSFRSATLLLGVLVGIALHWSAGRASGRGSSEAV